VGYFDFRSGCGYAHGANTVHGGSGTLPASPSDGRGVGIGLISLAIVAAVGLFFSIVSVGAILPLGILGMSSDRSLHHRAPAQPANLVTRAGVGIRTLMVMGTHFALTGQYSWTAFVAFAHALLLVSNLLLLNQFPDVDADRSVGRRHYPILIGRRKSSLIYAAFLACAYLSIIAGVLLYLLPTWALLGLPHTFLAIPAARTAYSRPTTCHTWSPP